MQQRIIQIASGVEHELPCIIGMQAFVMMQRLVAQAPQTQHGSQQENDGICPLLWCAIAKPNADALQKRTKPIAEAAQERAKPIADATQERAARCGFPAIFQVGFFHGNICGEENNRIIRGGRQFFRLCG